MCLYAYTCPAGKNGTVISVDIVKCIMKSVRWFTGVMALLAATGSFAQTSLSDTSGDFVAARKYVFTPRQAQPLTGPVVNLLTGFSLVVKGDSVNCYLPYFGRAFAGIPYGSNSGGIEFAGIPKSYRSKAKKKGSYEITIVPPAEPGTDVRELNLQVTSSGYATLRVSSNNRQSISFTGVADPIRNK